MKRLLLILAFALAGSASHAELRYFYDVQKFQTILENPQVESLVGVGSLDGIDLMKIDDLNRTIDYTLKLNDGACSVKLILGFDAGFNPNYRVISVGTKVCN